MKNITIQLVMYGITVATAVVMYISEGLQMLALTDYAYELKNRGCIGDSSTAVARDVDSFISSAGESSLPWILYGGAIVICTHGCSVFVAYLSARKNSNDR
jgi:hypothetical protein